MKLPSPKIFLIPLLILSMINCKGEKQDDSLIQDTEKQNSGKLTKTDIDQIKYVDYILSDQSANLTADWVRFNGLLEEVEKLKKGELNFFKEDIVLIRTLTEEFNNTIPEKLKVPEVTTRISVLENSLFNLHSELNLERDSKTYSLKSIKELLIALSNLKLQINKKLEMDSQNIIKPQ